MSTALSVKDKFTGLHKQLNAMESELIKTIPKHIDPKKAIRVLLTSIRKNPKLLNCTPASVMGCLMEASTLGLMLDGVTGEAYPIPYGKECTLVAGYKGLAKLAYQSDRVLLLTARVVHEKDKYEFVQGIDESIKHIPTSDPEPGPAVAFYSVAKLKGGGVKFEWMWKHEVDRIRNASPSKNSDGWKNHYDEMGKKTVVRRNCKLLPASPELQTLVAYDEMADAGIAQNLAASAGFIIEGDENRYSNEPETGTVRIDNLKEVKQPGEDSTGTPLQQVQAIHKQGQVTRADFDTACTLSGLSDETLDVGAIAAYADSGEFVKAIRAILDSMIAEG